MDLIETGSGSEEMNSSNNSMKKCSDCQTTKTPLWRGGPAGPKSLCNACGIRYRKRRRDLLGINRGVVIPKKERTSISNSKIRVSLNLRFLNLGKEVMMQRSPMENQRRNLGAEEEQAAVLLMALSCGGAVCV